MTSQTGRCLCGAIRYKVTGPIGLQGHCHCETCRRATSSPITTFFVALKDDVTFEGIEPTLYRSSPDVKRTFCPKCGTPISYEHATYPDEIHLYATSLDDPSRISPERHDFWNERVDWLTVTDELDKHEG
ncbi:MAG: GFA family protein [Pseudomonadota bacterium]